MLSIPRQLPGNKRRAIQETGDPAGYPCTFRHRVLTLVPGFVNITVCKYNISYSSPAVMAGCRIQQIKSGYEGRHWPAPDAGMPSPPDIL